MLRAEKFDSWTLEQQSMFYAEAWALVHYLILNGDNRTDFVASLGAYVESVRHGIDEDSAFQRAFGLSTGELDGEVRSYLRGTLTGYSLPLSRLPASETRLKVRPLSEEEMAIQLGTLCLVRGEGRQAQDYFEAALALNPSNPRALAGQGDALKFQEQFDLALPYFERSVELDPSDALNQLDMAEYWLDLALISGTAPEERRQHLGRARRHFARSHELDPDNPETYAIHGYTFLADGEEAAEGIESLEHAHALLPANLDISLMLARAYVEVERRDEARSLLQNVQMYSHEGSATQLLRELLAETKAAETPEAADQE